LEVQLLAKSYLQLEIVLLPINTAPSTCTKAFSVQSRGDELATLHLQELESGCHKITWTATQNLTIRKLYYNKFILEDCIQLQTIPMVNESRWYGGAELFDSHYVSTATSGSIIPMQPFISSDIFASETKLGGILQALWLNSQGWSVSADSNSDKMVPLWVSFRDTSDNNYSSTALCLRGSYQSYSSRSCHRGLQDPSDPSPCPPLQLSYTVCKDNNLLTSWTRYQQQIPYNTSSPDRTALEKPIWSTWAEYKVFINQSAVLDYARRIVLSGYPHSVLEIDDRWSSSYGDFTFDTVKFPDPVAMIRELHSLNFSVMLWVTPFCDLDATVFEEGLQHRYWVLNSTTTAIDQPWKAYPVRWWENNRTGSAVLDVTNPAAMQWFTGRLRRLQLAMGVDGFKLDAGEVVYTPPLTDPHASYFNPLVFRNLTQPLQYTSLYASIANELGGFTEVRAAWHTQRNRNFVRVMDLDSVWGEKDGLGSVIPRVLLLGTLGYRFVLPDMVGGNGYGARGDLLFRGAPPAELYIRWLQCNLLLPMQLSIPPWRYRNDSLYSTVLQTASTVFRARERLLLFYRNAIRDAVFLGEPLARPMWFEAPEDPNSLGVEDQYLVGRWVVVAPVLQLHAVSRSVYLPPGRWVACSRVVKGESEEVETREVKGRNVSMSWKEMTLGKSPVIVGPITFILRDIFLDTLTPCFLKLML